MKIFDKFNYMVKAVVVKFKGSINCYHIIDVFSKTADIGTHSFFEEDAQELYINELCKDEPDGMFIIVAAFNVVCTSGYYEYDYEYRSDVCYYKSFRPKNLTEAKEWVLVYQPEND